MPGAPTKKQSSASVPAPCVAPPNNDDNNDNAFSKSMSDEVTFLPSPCAAPPNDDDDDYAFSKNLLDVDLSRAEGLVIDIAGIAVGDCGCRRKEHKVCCGKVVDVDRLYI